jgi:tetraacyldisaccharide 4'-kinase
LARALSPLGRLYAAATARRIASATPRSVGIPVICVGNINAGGTGKTPTVIALAARLESRGIKAHVVSRGYGRAMTGTARVDERRHIARDVGDEPLLLSAFTPVWVADNRVAGAIAARDAGAQAILLDDGLQDPSLAHDLTMIMVDAARGFGNGLCLPAGPLREPVATGLARADFLVSIGDDTAQQAFARIWSDQVTIPHLRARLDPLQTGMHWQDQPVLAFAGIGHPEKFFATLRGLGAQLVGMEALDDHQPYTTAIMRRLEMQAEAAGAQLVTTEKDAVRLPADFRAKVLVLPVRLTLEDWDPLDAAFARNGL